MKKKLVIVSVLLVAVILALVKYVAITKEAKDEVVMKNIVAGKEKSTDVYATLNVPIENKNMIWCGTMQLAWNELRDNIIKEDIKLEGGPSTAIDLNKKLFTKENLNDKDYIAMAGYKRDDIVNKINKSLEEKFKEGGKWKVELTLQHPDDILAYSFLKKNIAFKNAFEVLEDGMEFKGKRVTAFGIDKIKESKKDKLKEQIKLLNYNNEDDFILELIGDNSENKLVLAKVPPKGTLQETLDYAMTNRKEVVGNVNEMKIPKISFKADKSFKELEGKRLLNKNFTEYAIDQAIQKTEFTLTEKGAVLKSKAEIATKNMSNPKNNLNLIFDKPFLIYMTEKNSNNPYFVLWVYDSEMMTEK